MALGAVVESLPMLRLVPLVTLAIFAILPDPITYNAPELLNPAGIVKDLAILKLPVFVNVPVVPIVPPEFKNTVPLLVKVPAVPLIVAPIFTREPLATVNAFVTLVILLFTVKFVPGKPTSPTFILGTLLIVLTVV